MSFQLSALAAQNLRRVPTTPNVFRKGDLRVAPNVMAVTKRIPPLEMRRNFANSVLNQVPHIPQMSLGRKNVPQTDAHSSATM
jgi:hypothetical protein